MSDTEYEEYVRETKEKYEEARRQQIRHQARFAAVATFGFFAALFLSFAAGVLFGAANF